MGYSSYNRVSRGTWVAQSAEGLTSAQVTISQFVDSSPTSGFVLTAQSLLQILSPSLSAPPPFACVCVFSLSLSKINKNIMFFFK